MIHSRTLSSGEFRYFYRIFKFYNIGNTTVTIPSNYLPTQDYINNKLGRDDYCLGGVKYSFSTFNPTSSSPKYYYTAQLYVDYARAVFLKPGTYTVLPTVYDRKIEAIIYTTESYSYRINQSGYNFRLYIDSDGVYQGEYSELGAISKLDINEVTYHGGTIEYYDDWH